MTRYRVRERVALQLAKNYYTVLTSNLFIRWFMSISIFYFSSSLELSA